MISFMYALVRKPVPEVNPYPNRIVVESEVLQLRRGATADISPVFQGRDHGLAEVSSSQSDDLKVVFKRRSRDAVELIGLSPALKGRAKVSRRFATKR